MNWNGCGRKRSWPNMKCFPEFKCGKFRHQRYLEGEQSASESMLKP